MNRQTAGSLSAAKGAARGRAPAKEPTALAPVGASFTDEQAAALVAAGRLLQKGGRAGWPGGPKKIERRPGESYPAAVLRLINILTVAERQHLRELVAWVMDYEKSGRRQAE